MAALIAVADQWHRLPQSPLYCGEHKGQLQRLIEFPVSPHSASTNSGSPPGTSSRPRRANVSDIDAPNMIRVSTRGVTQ
jgi:hypothetical protein